MNATASANDQGPLANIPRERFPDHIAFIMDGNGRWAKRQGLPRIEGHRRGVSTVREVVEEASRLGLKQVSLYCLSSENWKRPENELNFLMALLEQYLIEERAMLNDNNVVVKIIGRRDGIPENVQEEMNRTIEMTANNTGTTLCLAINYGSRAELVDATREIARQVQQGDLEVDSIDESLISRHLNTRNMPDPDLLVRTAGEMRVSNFLLWQISYAEIWVTEKCWPEFSKLEFEQAIADYASRERRYGGLPDTSPSV